MSWGQKSYPFGRMQCRTYRPISLFLAQVLLFCCPLVENFLVLQSCVPAWFFALTFGYVKILFAHLPQIRRVFFFFVFVKGILCRFFLKVAYLYVFIIFIYYTSRISPRFTFIANIPLSSMQYTDKWVWLNQCINEIYNSFSSAVAKSLNVHSVWRHRCVMTLLLAVFLFGVLFSGTLGCIIRLKEKRYMVSTSMTAQFGFTTWYRHKINESFFTLQNCFA